MSGQHSQFQVDGTQYLVESDCSNAAFPRLVDKVIRQLERIGKHAAAEMYGHEAVVCSYTKINHELVKCKLTVNPKGLPCS
ncbi:hypothetical protein Erwinia_phage_Fougasse_00061 [Erwinia phage Fougasse]|nr:hypothetical protein Erwinia_phage_Calisson_00050 [Erwinia phage Calisson]WJN63956.1 hypothetical protein Erwinia_phage_Farigoule_00069 [Erwinia phage Farigoule]WJN64024.1 hypothetical protein Erwinia_phage_Fougasse_00061 [Erwinia phage Fougasse]WJN64114.1 hypothetical protein Erwinia_phage_Mauresque_00072 [Erwinia phage Mauresque]WJN64190.1 hypothetical protein Erwinia_phage_Navette_00070 [Erwinia phage Navette]WJN64257.1 hypothetical protein Erwinia_phage_Nougat_00061 [Erwinia phage Nouga